MVRFSLHQRINSPAVHAIHGPLSLAYLAHGQFILCAHLQIPIYDFKSSKRVGYNTLEVPESRVVIIEGIYALSERLKPLLDLRVSITGMLWFSCHQPLLLVCTCMEIRGL